MLPDSMSTSTRTDQSPGAGSDPPDAPIAIIGAGPAGLTAALMLTDRRAPALVLEATDAIGGISQTVERSGWRFDIGGHRFFTKVPAVEALWHRILSDDDFLIRPRMSRIFYDGKFYDYPLDARNAVRNLGPLTALGCMASYAWAHIHPPKDQSSFEGWVQARFGRRLYQRFFKTYTEKVWGVPATEIQADWAAQRIKTLSLGAAVKNALTPRRTTKRKGGKQITSLIEEFRYPRLGPGMMWERCRELVEAAGVPVLTEMRVVRIARDERGATSVGTVDDRSPSGPELVEHPCSAVISSMPIGQLVEAMDPPAPPDVLSAARGLHHRDFLTVALVVPEAGAFPDNWIYIHEPGVHVGRIQNFGAWSPEMVQPGRTCLGLEYFVHEGDELWSMADEDLVRLATDEIYALGLLDRSCPPEQGYVVRMPRAYPVYDSTYAAHLETVRTWLAEAVPNVVPVGRNGMHRYNNQDHSMLTAMLAVENLLDDAGHDLWSVNVDEEYHETVSSDGDSSGRAPGGTGRAAPVISGR